MRLVDRPHGAAAPHAMLREATAEAHQLLHHLPVFEALAGGRLDAPAYRDLLGRLLGFHEPIEAAIAACVGDTAFGLDLRGLRRGGLLRDDLAELGLDAAAIAALPRDIVPPLASAPAAMGALYVTEGATLGGRQLARGLDAVLGAVLESRLGAGVTLGRRFLMAGADTARPAWRDVRAAIDRCGSDSGALAGMIAGARAAFTAFGAWFAPPSARHGAARSSGCVRYLTSKPWI